MSPEQVNPKLEQLQELTDNTKAQEVLMPLIAEVGSENLGPDALIQKLGQVVIGYADEHMGGARVPALNMLPKYAEILLDNEEDRSQIQEAWTRFKESYQSPPAPDRKTKKALAKPHYMRGHVEHKRIARHQKRSS